MIIIKWSIPVPITSRIPAIAAKSNCHLKNAANPRINTISDNKILLSKHVEEDKNYGKTEDELRVLARNLKTNLNSVEVARKTMGAVDFNPVFFLSEELTNAYLDNQLPMAWEFEHDLIVINNLDHSLLLDLLIKRGQKRIFLIGGNLDVANLKVEQPDVLVYRVEDHTPPRRWP